MNNMDNFYFFGVDLFLFFSLSYKQYFAGYFHVRLIFQIVWLCQNSPGSD